MLINITNGDYLNEKLKKEYEGEFFPFREAMIQGETTQVVLDEEFVVARAKSLNVGVDFYRQYATEIFNFARTHSKYSKTKLWFGKDTFCQLNLLTLLAFLEQINYEGEILLNLVCDETGEILEEGVKVTLGQYSSLYKTVLIKKQKPTFLGSIDKKAIELYFDYLSPHGCLANLVKQNMDLSEKELVVLLLNSSKEYGLSDLNVIELIHRVKKL